MKRTHDRALCTLLAVCGLPLLGCTASSDGSDPTTESVGRAREALSVYQWSPDTKAGNNNSYESAAITTFESGSNWEAVMVHTGDDDGDKEMYTSFSPAGLVWSDDEKIGQATSTAPRLATFNNHVYMVHTGEDDYKVWMSQLDTSATRWAWKHDFLLPYESWTSPAIAA